MTNDIYRTFLAKLWTRDSDDRAQDVVALVDVSVQERVYSHLLWMINPREGDETTIPLVELLAHGGGDIINECATLVGSFLILKSIVSDDDSPQLMANIESEIIDQLSDVIHARLSNNKEVQNG